MPSLADPILGNGHDQWMNDYLRSRGYSPECGNAECTECALRDREGYDYDGYDRSGYNENGEDRRGYTRHENGDCYGCDDCYAYDEPETDERLMNYSYTPTLKFNGDKAPFYGMEIEVTTDNVSSVLDVVEANARRLIYCKEDSSVEGLEMVTHPMSYPWAMENFPWDMLTEIRQAGGSVVAGDNGIHVHVGRDGFDNPAHLYRWMKLLYRNPSDVQRIARRRASHWGAFNWNHRAAHKHHVKYGKDNYRYSDDATRHERYAAINTSNDETLEVRVFASTLRPQRAQAALQLVAGSVEYARQLTSYDVTHRRGFDWQAFMAWAGKSGDYPALMVENRIRRYL